MNQRDLHRVERLLKLTEKRLGQRLFLEIPGAMTDHLTSGQMPRNSLHAAFIDLEQALRDLADTSIGDAEGHAQALARHSQALARYGDVLAEYGLSLPPGKLADPSRRWYPLRPHSGQRALWKSRARFRIAACGRRSGKSELAKRKGVSRAIATQRYSDARYAFCAPTHAQAKRIFWSDLKRLIPRHHLLGSDPRRAISESELTIRTASGAEIFVCGLDEPARIEGPALDFVVVDEIANCDASVWGEHIRPALSERGGEAWLIGVPEGRNFFYQLAQTAQTEQKDHPGLWAFFSWPSADILSPAEIAIAKSELDPVTFDQEYNASFVTFQGRVYYPFSRELHCEQVRYNPALDLFLCFDFNVSPGVCAILQETYSPSSRPQVWPQVTACIDEVWIESNSNTKRICECIVQRYHDHPGLVVCYGDSTGGARGSAKVEGSDWDLIRNYLTPVFGSKLRFRVPAANPKERIRVNAMNARLQAADGTIRFLVDPIMCPHTVMDFEGVTCTPDGSGDIDKKADPRLTHLTDAIGYCIAEKYPIVQHVTKFL